MVFLVTILFGIAIVVAHLRHVEMPKHTFFPMPPPPVATEGGQEYFDYIDEETGQSIRVFPGDEMYALIAASIRKGK